MDNINTTQKFKINSSSWDQTPIEQLHSNLQFHHQIPTHINSLHLQVPQQIPFSSSSVPYIPSNSLLLGEENEELEEQGPEQELGAMKEMIYKIAAMRPVDIDPATIPKPKRRNVRISDDPQSVAARHRRERISERIRILQRLVPGGTKMDTASMLDEAIQYVKFLKRQIRLLQSNNNQLLAHCPQGVLNSNSSPRLASSDVNWDMAVLKKLGHHHGSNPDSTGVVLAVGNSSFGENLGFNHEVISEYMING